MSKLTKKQESKHTEQPQGLSAVEKLMLKKEFEEYIKLQIVKHLGALETLADKISKIEELLSNRLQKTTNFKLQENASETEEERSYFDRIVNFNDEDEKIDPQELGDLTGDEAVDENFESLEIKKPNSAKPKIVISQNEIPVHADEKDDISVTAEKSDALVISNEVLEEVPKDKHSLYALLFDNPFGEQNENIPEPAAKLSDIISNSSETNVSFDDQEKEIPEEKIDDDITPVISKPSSLSEILNENLSDEEESQPKEKETLSLEEKYGDILGEELIHTEEQSVKKSFDLAHFAKTEAEIEQEPEQSPEQKEEPKKKGFLSMFKK